jgi:hypothetical protein
MNQSRRLYLIPLIIGWLVLGMGGYAVVVEGTGLKDLTYLVLVATVGFAFLITAVVVAIAERSSR